MRDLTWGVVAICHSTRDVEVLSTSSNRAITQRPDLERAFMVDDEPFVGTIRQACDLGMAVGR